MSSKQNLGQYFTTNLVLQEKVLEFILNEPTTILEPSVGQGDLVVFIKTKMPLVEFDMYEIDSTINLLEGTIIGDFIKQSIDIKYKTIIGNPPYIRTKKGNLYIDFIDKCYNLLQDNGELIFIVPSDFFKLTSASKLLSKMMMNGSFTHLFHPHNEKLFVDASIDVVIFRFCKNKNLEKKILYNDESMYIKNINGLITFSKEMDTNTCLFKDVFDVHVGLVTGKESVYKNKELGNIQVLNGQDKIDSYIYIESYPCDNDAINKHLLQHKQELIGRGIRNFNESNWFEWGAPRNINTIRSKLNQDCIYIYNLTRKSNVAFVGKITWFGGGLIMLKPKKDIDLNKIVSYLNSDAFKSNFIFSKRFKIGHRQISNSSIPNSII
jgi:adenine-specific DNA-methyltransferase